MKNAEGMDELKKRAALAAAALVESGQIVGLGTGSTAAFAIRELGRRVMEDGLKIRCVATSYQGTMLAREAGIIVEPLSLHDRVDISIDGADEIGPGLNLIKGGGGAHTSEKIVHAMSKRFLVVADVSKRSDRLGKNFAVPVEVIPDSVALVARRLRDLGAASVILRKALAKDGPVVTDHGNLILDAALFIDDAEALETALNRIPGVVENGVFPTATIAIDRAFLAGPEGVEVVIAGQ